MPNYIEEGYIIKEVTLNTTPGSSSLSQKIILYRGDRGICLRFKFTNTQYTCTDETKRCAISIIKPNGEPFTATDTNIGDEYIDLFIDENFCNAASEVGIYKMQIHIFYGEGSNKRVSFEPFTFEVRHSLLSVDVDPFVNNAVVDESQLTVTSNGEPIITSADISNGYTPTTWGEGDVITSNSLNKIELNLEDTVKTVNNIQSKLNASDVKCIKVVDELPVEGEWVPGEGVLYVVVSEG